LPAPATDGSLTDAEAKKQNKESKRIERQRHDKQTK